MGGHATAVPRTGRPLDLIGLTSGDQYDATMLAWMSVVASSFLKPEFWLEKAGKSAVYVVTAIIFAESGLFFGFFLPGDSLLFMTGFLTSSGAAKFAAENNLTAVTDHIPALWVLLLVFFVASLAGDQVGYWFGRRAGSTLFTREDSRLFKQSHVTKAHGFLERHGPKTVFLAKFVPIVRTFAPIVAGVGKMRYRTFLTFNVVGALIWAVGVTALGHFLGNVEFIRKNIEYTIIVVILVSLSPVLVELIRHRRSAARQEA